MEDKVFGLIEKLYIRMEEGFAQMASKSDLARVEANMTRMEQENAQKFGALFDGLTANTEAIGELRVGIAANTEAIGELRVGMAANTEAIGELRVGMAANTEAINELKVGLAQLDSREAKTAEAVRELTAEVKTLRAEVKNHEIKLMLVK